MKTFKIFSVLTAIIVLSWLVYLIFIPNFFANEDTYIPKIVNLSEKEGATKLKEAKLNCNIIYIKNDELSDIIIKTYPLENTLVKKNSMVNLYVLKAKDVVYPDYEGLIYKEVKEDIKKFCDTNNIKLNVKYVINNDYPKDVILKQDKKSGSLIEGKSFNIQVITHDNLIQMPNVIGKNLKEGIKLLEEVNLSYKIIYVTSFLPFDTIIEQNYQLDSLVLKGNKSPIILHVSKGLRF